MEKIYIYKPFKEKNWNVFIDVIIANFLNDVQQN
jgi:hypothetical protein